MRLTQPHGSSVANQAGPTVVIYGSTRLSDLGARIPPQVGISSVQVAGGLSSLAASAKGARLPRLAVIELPLQEPPSEIIPVLAEVSASIPLLLYGRLTSRMARDVVELAKCCMHVRIAFDGYDDLCAAVNRSLHDEADEPGRRILSYLAASTPGCAHDIVVAASIMGRRRTQVGELAHLCEVPMRTLEWRLRAAGIISARELLGKMLSLHIMWALDVQRWPLKRVRRATGFRSDAALANYVERQIGLRPLAAARQLGFCGLLEALTVDRMHRSSLAKVLP
jgi:hypothetical protein